MSDPVSDLRAAVAQIGEFDFGVAAEECDIVMKGGITSGVIYPLAVAELARRYRLRNVGGASAGAIAAAAAAAAEAGRGSGGFGRLAALPAWLTDHLSSLFQPARATRPPFAVLYAATHPSKRLRTLRAIVAAIRTALPSFAVGLAGTGLVTYGALSLLGADRALSITLAVMLGLLVGVVAIAVRHALVLTVDVPGNFYGVCSGFAPPRRDASKPRGAPKPLTTWLDETLSSLAGVDRVLTFGDLWGPAAVAADRALDEVKEPTIPQRLAARELRAVNLEVMTTCLSEGRPRRIPFEDRIFSFCPADMRALFPKRVVDHLLDHGTPAEDEGPTSYLCPTDPRHGRLVKLPAARDLPVVVAARMSLSFPVFLSAVRLYAVNYSRKDPREHQPVPCWFSDGGITSNFPVHFFDTLLPRRPTFGLNLGPYPRDYHDEDIYFPATAGAGIRPGYRSMGSLGAFGSLIAGTAQNWRDNAQVVLPGYRDRIAIVRHTKAEGGMNLRMPPATIAALALRGREAAQAIVETFRFDAHRWTRFRSSMSLLAQSLATMRAGYVATPDGYETFLPAYGPAAARYAMSGVWRTFAIGGLGNLMAVAEQWDAGPRRYTDDPPRPEPTLRITPLV